jgi:4-hydroxyphenylpyruvate dioxygenase
MAKPLPRSIATVSLAGSLPEKLEAAAGAGFDGVEIFENDLLTFAGRPAEVRRLAEDLGLEILMLQPFRDFEAMPEPARSRNFERAERKFDVMQGLGADLLLVCSNVHAAAIGDEARAAADLAEIAERAARRGLRIGYEALAWGRHVRHWQDAWRLVRTADHDALGLVLDSFHALALGDDIAAIAQLPAAKIFFVQLADAPLLMSDPISWSRHYRSFPGQGDLDTVGFLRAVLASGYGGPLSLEIFNDSFRATAPQLTARDGMRSLVFVEAEAGGRPLPELPEVSGIEFIEFAVDDASGAALADFLGRLGFAGVGHHRSKAVDLYRQGGVTLILNREPDSAASYHFELHGPSVCAIALGVDDTGRALARARALGCSIWEERVGAGERHVPAVRAPDGMLIHLVAPDPAGRTIYEDDFRLTAGPPPGIGLLAVDHIAQALPHERLDSFVLFWRAVFGLVPQPVWEIADPYGLIRSRAMVSPEGNVRLPLNVSESRQTATGRFLSAYAGAGIHHLAFGAADIRRALAAYLAAGGKTLAIPANYYDDLAARFPLVKEEIEELRAANLLYDREDGGSFVHAYTANFADRLFFEFVERRGYSGFGAANAAVRLAAQAQEGAAAERQRVAFAIR